jgi:thiol-disulfide isomerase/thioredoxin
MSPRRGALLIALALSALVVSSCGSDSAATATSRTQASVGSASADPTWVTLQLTDVTGNQFSIADFAGRPVFVENFATWCSNCLRQLGDTQNAASQAGDSAVFLALSVETDLDATKVAAYAQKNGFDDIRFAVMTPEFLAATDDLFGNSALNPPSTPKVVVDAAGKPGKLVTGFESPGEILAQVTQAGE